MAVFQPFGQPGSFFDQAQQAFQLYQQQLQPIYYPNILKGNANTVASSSSKPRNEPTEFQWLRNRVNEILWK